eukprot:snap_masked-scaffold_1-processed-gene-3.30-mRNA-1 protein AED:1.00 eAED:1.00 QI:0/0/0/0/1/1/2/0/453
MLCIGYFIEDEVQKESKYNLDSKDELITRTIKEKGFIEQYTTRSYDSGFQSHDIYFRVYDFGQEVFSSVHHIFMNKNAYYLVVFNLTKLKEKDLYRLKFWCESILKNSPKAPVMFIGTFLNTFLKKNKTLEKVNYTIKSFLSELSGELNILKDKETIFFPVENGFCSDKFRGNLIKDRLRSIVAYMVLFYSGLFIGIRVKSIYVLFLDNCREESSYITVEKFKLKAKKCNFSEEEMEEMLERYSKEIIISYFKDINLSETQALRSFIRDESFHQLAFRTNNKVFSNYRKYIDTGIIRKNLFDVLLKQYTRKEREYVLHLALHSLILFVDPRKKKALVVPELLPEVKDKKLKGFYGNLKKVNFPQPITKTTFLKVISISLSEDSLIDSFLFNSFARFIFGAGSILDIYINIENIMIFNYIGYKINTLIWTKIQSIVEELCSLDEEVEENFLTKY